MFWGSFSYDKKGSCYIWRPETAKEKEGALVRKGKKGGIN
jgi:hypothetical protein